MDSLKITDSWPCDTAAVAVVGRDGTRLGTHGPAGQEFALASVTKLLTAYATLVAVEEEAVLLDDPAGPEGSTIEHLLAHTSGLAFDGYNAIAKPGARRIYSNTGFEVLGHTVEEATEIPFAEYVRQAVLEPLGMTSTRIAGSCAADGVSTVDDLAKFAAELMNPQVLAPLTVAQATSVAFPGLDGVVPGYGRQNPSDWGLGFEIKGTKKPHWTGDTNSPSTFGHFGQRGTFLWVDPALGAACVVLTDKDFGPWAAAAWTPFNDAVVEELKSRNTAA